MKQCPKCEIRVISGNYCRTCGIVLIPIPEYKCECGGSLSEYDNYCRWCGKEIKDDETVFNGTS